MSAVVAAGRTSGAAAATPRAVLSLLGLSAVIAGLLTMHIWVGGFGASSHHGTVAVGGTAAGPAAAPPGTGHLPAPAALIGAAAADHDSMPGCAGSCADEAAFGMCMLALVIMGAFALRTPSGCAPAFSLANRGPPALPRAFRPAPCPSLTQLCISRT
ncbi:hypothetical protein [Arthrobacter sp. Z1-15]